MSQHVKTISIDKLIAHPDNPNRMSDKTFAKLVRNIERTGRYEPIIVRLKDNSYEIINGHHRVKALRQLGIKTADIVIWDVNDEETDILLTTLNRLSGSDELDKKLAILRRLNEKMRATELAKLLPFSSTQIERLKYFKLPTAPAKIESESFTHPLVFFVNRDQLKIINEAMSLATTCKDKNTKAAALTHIAEHFINQIKKA